MELYAKIRSFPYRLGSLNPIYRGMKVKLSDYIVQRLREWGVDQVFMVTGGGAMHLNDSLAGQAACRLFARITSRAQQLQQRAIPVSAGRPESFASPADLAAPMR